MARFFSFIFLCFYLSISFLPSFAESHNWKDVGTDENGNYVIFINLNSKEKLSNSVAKIKMTGIDFSNLENSVSVSAVANCETGEYKHFDFISGTEVFNKKIEEIRKINPESPMISIYSELCKK